MRYILLFFLLMNAHAVTFESGESIFASDMNNNFIEVNDSLLLNLKDDVILNSFSSGEVIDYNSINANKNLVIDYYNNQHANFNCVIDSLVDGVIPSSGLNTMFEDLIDCVGQHAIYDSCTERMNLTGDVSGETYIRTNSYDELGTTFLDDQLLRVDCSFNYIPSAHRTVSYSNTTANVTFDALAPFEPNHRYLVNGVLNSVHDANLELLHAAEPWWTLFIGNFTPLGQMSHIIRTSNSPTTLTVYIEVANYGRYLSYTDVGVYKILDVVD